MDDRTILDPVAAYDKIAACFSQISGEKHEYLLGIEGLIAARIPSNSRSLLDVGAGNGSRSTRIARLIGLTEVTLLEPSFEMIKNHEGKAEVWPIRAEDLESELVSGKYSLKERRFDVIISLWNVLGHIDGPESKIRVLSQLGNMLSANGKLFVDVNHRYNVRSYGLLRTAGRFVRDLLFPRSTNGDVEVVWHSGTERVRTRGHVFTDREVRRLASIAKLTVEERIAVDYDNGEVKRFAHDGNLLYVLRSRSASNDSRSASQTSSTSVSVI